MKVELWKLEQTLTQDDCEKPELLIFNPRMNMTLWSTDSESVLSLIILK